MNAERANVDELNIVRLGHTVDIILKYTKSKKSYLQAVATYMDDSIFNPDDCDVNTEFVTINIGLFITRQFALLYKTLLEDDSLMNYITEKEFVLLCESIYDDVFYMFYHEH